MSFLNSYKTPITDTKSRKGIVNAFVYLVLGTFLLISIMPVFWTWVAALKPKMDLEMGSDPLSFPSKIDLTNLVTAWVDGKMGIYTINSIITTIPIVFCVVIMASLAGYAFAKLKFPGRDGMFYFFLFGLMIPVHVLLISIYFTNNNFGLIDKRLGVILPSIGLAMPFGIFMMRAFYRDLPYELMESAKIDGCNKLKVLISIMMPLSKPAISALIVFQFMWSWNDLALPMLIYYSDTVRTLPMGLLFFKGEYYTNETLIAAGATIATFPIVLIYLLFQKTFIQGITSGALKG